MADWVELTASDGHKLKAWRPRQTEGRARRVEETFGVNNHIRDIERREGGYRHRAQCSCYQRDFETGYAPTDG
jgi:hypothetical protein